MKLFLIFVIGPMLLFASSMEQKVEALIDKNKIQHSKVSVLIKNAKTGEILCNINANKPKKPASVMKVLTTYASLLELGENFKWPTKILYRGRYKNGVLSGDLVIKGYGDPTLTTSHLAKIAKRIKSIGIRKITGDIILDRSFFHVGNKINSGFDAHYFSEYNAMPNAIMINDHLSSITIKPKNGKIQAYKRASDESYKIINKIKPSSKSCRGNRSWPRVLINTDSIPSKVTLSGTLSLKCGPRVVRKVITYSHRSFYHILVSQLHKAGISYHGKMKLATTLKHDKALFTHYSKPLLQIISKTNKKSNNLYARHIMLLLGAKVYGAPATLKKGRAAVKHILSNKGKAYLLGVKMDNGCGLSRSARITASSLSSVLQSANHRFGQKWRKALSIAGVDGTIRKRFKRSIAKGRAWMKTGTLKDAKNISGYVLSKGSKRLYSVVVLYNGYEKWKGSSLQNQIINWLAR